MNIFSTMYKTLQRNSLWLLFSRICAHGLGILFVAIIARQLGVEGFGRFALLGSIILIGNTVTNFGTDTYLIRELSREGKITDLIPRSLGLQIIFSAIWVLLTVILIPDAALILYSLSLFPLAVFSVSTSTLRAFERMDLILALSIVNGVVQVVAAAFSRDVRSLCLYLFIGQILVSAISFGICNIAFPRFELFKIYDPRPLLALTFPFAILTVLLVISQRLGVFMVSSMLGEAQTGIYSSTTRVIEGLKLGHYAVLGALLPIMSRGGKESRRNFFAGFSLLMMTGVITALGLILFSSQVITLLYGEGYNAAIRLLSLYGWMLLPFTISSFISYDLVARQKEKILVIATAISLLSFLLLYAFLIRGYGLVGAIYAGLIGETVQAFILSLAAIRANFISEYLVNSR